jgi:hypothetical protein
MASYVVRRTVETVATKRAASEGAAARAAAAKVAEQLGAGEHADRSVEAETIDVYEFPAAPFEPYRFTVRATVAVAVDAGTETAAIEAGDAAIDGLVADADLDEWEYVGSTELEATA